MKKLLLIVGVGLIVYIIAYHLLCAFFYVLLVSGFAICPYISLPIGILFTIISIFITGLIFKLIGY